MTKDFMIRKVNKVDLLRLDTLAKLKGFKSREAYVRQLIHRNLHEEVELHSNQRYLDLVQQLLTYLSIQERTIQEHNELIQLLISQKVTE